MTCPRAADGLGAYVLGVLEPDERAAMVAHLRTCRSCADELAEFSELPALLDRVRPEDLRTDALDPGGAHPAPVAPSAELFDRLAAVAAPPSRLRARAVAVVAAVLLAVAGVGVGLAVRGGDPQQTVTAAAGAVQATVTATSVDDGSALDVTVAGLRPGEECRLVAVDAAGGRHAAGTWPASPAGGGTWRGWADLDRARLAEVVLLGDGGRELVRLPF